MIGTVKAFLGGLSLAWRLAILGAVLGAFGWAAWSAYSWAHGRGVASRDGEVATLTGERDAARSRVGELETANTINVSTIEGLAAANERLAGEAKDQRARAAAEADGLRASLDRLSSQLHRTTTERASAYASDPNARAWSAVPVPAAVDRSLRE